MRVIAVLLAMGLAGHAQACEILEEFNLNDIAEADIVMIATVTDLDRQTDGFAMLTVTPTEVLKGDAPDAFTMIWLDGLNNGPPDAWVSTTPVLLGVVRGPGGDETFVNPRPSMPRLVQPICGAPWLVDATPANVAVARMAVGG